MKRLFASVAVVGIVTISSAALAALSAPAFAVKPAPPTYTVTFNCPNATDYAYADGVELIDGKGNGVGFLGVIECGSTATFPNQGFPDHLSAVPDATPKGIQFTAMRCADAAHPSGASTTNLFSVGWKGKLPQTVPCPLMNGAFTTPAITISTS